MEKGMSQYWTERTEKYFERVLAGCTTFAQRHLVMTIRDLLKYDGRTKEGRRVIAQGRLRLATATDQDLEELTRLASRMPWYKDTKTMSDRLEELKQLRDQVRKTGVRKKELRA